MVFTFEDGVTSGDLLQFPIDLVVIDETAALSIVADVAGVTVASNLTNDQSAGVVGMLPRTGLETDRIALAGTLMLLLGAVLLFLGRKREDEATE